MKKIVIRAIISVEAGRGKESVSHDITFAFIPGKKVPSVISNYPIVMEFLYAHPGSDKDTLTASINGVFYKISVVTIAEDVTDE